MIKIGVVGYGYWGPNLVRNFSLVDDAQVVAVCDQSPERRHIVERVYPSADVLPSNQLRVYIYFSAPMSRGEAGQRIHVLDSNGKPLRGIFLPGQELWDPDNRRLTMTFDPGRIKRDLTSNRAMGPPIAEGGHYTLVIDREWPDANGVPMIASFTKPFCGGPAVRQPPDPKTWKITKPLQTKADFGSVEGLIDGIRRFESLSFDDRTIRENALRFAPDRFAESFTNLLLALPGR